MQRPDVSVQLGYIWPLRILCIDGTNIINNWRYTTGWLPSEKENLSDCLTDLMNCIVQGVP